MAWLSIRFFSQELGVSTSAEVLLPQPNTQGQIGTGSPEAREKYPALYLLHGWSDDETIWMRRTSIERYASRFPLVVVMPRVDLSYYQDTQYGMDYWTYLADELPSLCESWFPIDPSRESRFAAGLSMGGYGAFRLGLAKPDHFSAVASLSGALDLEGLVKMWENDPSRRRIMRGNFGDLKNLAKQDSNLTKLLRTTPKADTRFYQWCGTEDFLYDGNQRFREAAGGAGLNLTYRESPGDHSWEHWDREIDPVLDWLMSPEDQSPSRHTRILLDSYLHYFGEDLVPRGPGETERLMNASFVVLSHGTEEDPVFNYGNQQAQTLFEMDWDTLTSLPSRLSAEPLHREERQKLLDEVRSRGFSDNYGGIRVSATGKRFRVEGARVWTLSDESGKPVGQAASFSDWKRIDPKE